jgi:trk system potassium uptake protein TrkA
MRRFAVIGLGRFGAKLAAELSRRGAEVIAIDERAEVVETMRDKVSIAVRLDATDPDALRSQGVDQVDVAVVSIGTNFEATALCTSILKGQFKVPEVYSRGSSPTRSEILRRIGADKVINPEEEAALHWTEKLVNPHIQSHIELAQGYSLIQVDAPAAFHGKTLLELDLRKRYGINIVSIRRHATTVGKDGEEATEDYVLQMPAAETAIEPGDVLSVFGADEDIERLTGIK